MNAPVKTQPILDAQECTCPDLGTKTSLLLEEKYLHAAIFHCIGKKKYFKES